MNSHALRVTNPLTHRLFRRILLFSLLLILPLTGLRAWWEYRAALDNVRQVLNDIENTQAKALANSLRNSDRQQLDLHLAGIRNFPFITYAAVVQRGQVLAENGVRKDSDALLRETPLVRRQEDHEIPLDVLLVQADLSGARVRAYAAALRTLAVDTALALLVSLALFLLVRSMISRHLAAAAAHFQSLGITGPGEHPAPLTLDKKPAGDELDVLAQAVNAMRQNLARSHDQISCVEQEVASQARFPEENPNPVLRVSAEGVLLIANKASADFLAHMGSAPGFRVPRRYADIVLTALASGTVQDFEVEYGGRTIAFVAKPILPDGFVNLYGMDITGRKEAANAVLQSLHEKEILLKEIHHRVKNNLQIISSLLFLQMESVSDPWDRVLFSESQARIQAMALVHEELYGAKDLSCVDMHEYVPRLVDHVAASAEIPVWVAYDVDEVRLPVTRSIPCGLLLNELVMNAVKHAFRRHNDAREHGSLRVSLRRKENRLTLSVEDDGPGLPPGFDLAGAATLGLTLVSALSAQLGGKATAENLTPGARFSLTFPLENA